MSEASLLGDIGEAASGILTVQAIPVGWISTIEVHRNGHSVADVPAVHEKNVQQSVVVVIEEGYASRHGFNQILPGGRRVAENKINTLRGFHLEHRVGIGFCLLSVQNPAEFTRTERKQQRQQLSSGHPYSR